MKEDLDNEPDYMVSPLLASTEVISAQASYSLTRHSREVVFNMVERSECTSLCESDQVRAKRMVCFTYRKKRVVSVYNTPRLRRGSVETVLKASNERNKIVVVFKTPVLYTAGCSGISNRLGHSQMLGFVDIFEIRG
jgi:hypothetical protein